MEKLQGVSMGELTDLVARTFDVQDKRIKQLTHQLQDLLAIIDNLPCDCICSSVKCANCIAKDKAVKVFSSKE